MHSKECVIPPRLVLVVPLLVVVVLVAVHHFFGHKHHHSSLLWKKQEQDHPYPTMDEPFLNSHPIPGVILTLVTRACCERNRGFQSYDEECDENVALWRVGTIA